jgi:hypothetical protein
MSAPRLRPPAPARWSNSNKSDTVLNMAVAFWFSDKMLIKRLLGPARDAKLYGDNCDEWKSTDMERSKQETSALLAQDGLLAWERASEFSLRAQKYTVHREATPKCGLAAFAEAHRGQLRIVGFDSFPRFRQSMSPYMSRIRCAVDSYPPSHSCTLP